MKFPSPPTEILVRNGCGMCSHKSGFSIYRITIAESKSNFEYFQCIGKGPKKTYEVRLSNLDEETTPCMHTQETLIRALHTHTHSHMI